MIGYAFALLNNIVHQFNEEWNCGKVLCIANSTQLFLSWNERFWFTVRVIFNFMMYEYIMLTHILNKPL